MDIFPRFKIDLLK